MNAPAKVENAKAKEPDNLRIWNALAKTDPAHTKGFKRAGGFQGTALKPIWVEKQLTELFGPCGVGWGIDEPSFRLVEAGDELMVYCTVAGWYVEDGKRATVYGVGGDKVISKNKFGLQADDEAFKKACTDATGNAFKHVGVGADIHMGLFDDSKYVAERRAEFAANDVSTGEEPPKKPVKLDGPYTSKTALWAAVKAFVHACNGFSTNDELLPYLDTPDSKALLEQCKRDAPGLWSEGLPELPEYEPLAIFIARKRREFDEIENIHSNTRTVIDAG